VPELHHCECRQQSFWKPPAAPPYTITRQLPLYRGLSFHQINRYKHTLTNACTASSDDFLFLFDTFELPQTPTREFLNETAGTVSSNSTPSFQSLQEKQERSEMDSLKRKLSGARRPENSSRNLLPELNLYKQNNIALQKQIELLMAKLSDSKRREREAQAAREQAEYERAEWEFQAEKASRLSKNERDLQNTTGHPDSRRAMTNSVRLEAEEQPCDIRVDKSPLDVDLHDCRDPMVTDPGIAMVRSLP